MQMQKQNSSPARPGVQGRLVPKDWEQFQHYKDRRPPWIKIHRSLLDDRAYMALPVEARALAPLLWLLASENSPPSVEASDVAWRLRLPEQEVQVALQALVASGFVILEASCKQDASAVLAECLHVATPERERGEYRGDQRYRYRDSVAGVRVSRTQSA